MNAWQADESIPGNQLMSGRCLYVCLQHGHTICSELWYFGKYLLLLKAWNAFRRCMLCRLTDLRTRLSLAGIPIERLIEVNFKLLIPVLDSLLAWSVKRIPSKINRSSEQYYSRYIKFICCQRRCLTSFIMDFRFAACWESPFRLEVGEGNRVALGFEYGSQAASCVYISSQKYSDPLSPLKPWEL